MTAYLAFEQWAEARGLRSIPRKPRPCIEIVSGNNLILATPTGTGKSLVAIGAHFVALAQGKRSYYTRTDQGTGQREVLRPRRHVRRGQCRHGHRRLLRQRRSPDHRLHRRDPGEHRAPPRRRSAHRPGRHGRVPLLCRPGPRLGLAGSPARAAGRAVPADVGHARRRHVLASDLTRRTGRQTAMVTGAERPVPLHYRYATTPMHETIERPARHRAGADLHRPLLPGRGAGARAGAAERQRRARKEQKDAIAGMIGGFRFTTSFGKTLSRLVRHGHRRSPRRDAAQVPAARRAAGPGRPAQVICGTDTLGVGINVPIRTVVFSALSQYDGTRTRQLSAREFHQIAGSRRPRGLRHRRHRRRPGARARDRERSSCSRRPGTTR